MAFAAPQRPVPVFWRLPDFRHRANISRSLKHHGNSHHARTPRGFSTIVGVLCCNRGALMSVKLRNALCCWHAYEAPSRTGDGDR